MIPFAFRLKAALAVAGVALVVAAFAYVAHLRNRADQAEREVAVAQATAAVAGVQADVQQDAAAIADHAQSRALSITVKAQEAEHGIRTFPEADAPLPPALRDRIRAGVLGVRERGPVGAAPDRPGGGEHAPALPEARR